MSMAKSMSMPKTHFATLLSVALALSLTAVSASDGGGDHRRRELLGLTNRREKLSHFRFFWHDVFTGPNASVVNIISPPANQTSSSFFGMVNMIDDPLTAGPDPNSKLLGRAQGFYGVAAQREVALLMAMNFFIVEGKYKGSSITILGRNAVFDKVREMPVIAGSGLFRFARGYAHATTHTFDTATGNAVVEYNVYVLHYG